MPSSGQAEPWRCSGGARLATELLAMLGELMGVEHDGYGEAPGHFQDETVFLRSGAKASVLAELFVPVQSDESIRSRVSRSRNLTQRYEIEPAGSRPSIDLGQHLMLLPTLSTSVIVDRDGLHVQLLSGTWRTRSGCKRLLGDVVETAKALRSDELSYEQQVRNREGHPTFRPNRLRAFAQRDPERAAATALEFLDGGEEPLDVRVALVAAARASDHVFAVLAEPGWTHEQRKELARRVARCEPVDLAAVLAAHPRPATWRLASGVLPDTPEGRDAMLMLTDRCAADAGTATIVAKWLGELPSTPEAVDARRTLFAHPTPGVTTVAARSLAAHGTVEDVAILQARARGAGLESTLIEAIEEAVRGIQARSGGARGGLSAPAAGGGERSVVDRSPRREREGGGGSGRARRAWRR